MERPRKPLARRGEPTLGDRYLDAAMRQMRGNLASALTVRSVADALCSSESYLSKLFKRKVGHSPGRYRRMVEAGKEFHSVIQAVSALAKEKFRSPLTLGAGGCRLCESCAAKTGEPCRHPDKTVASLESYCIQVSELAVLAGMKYINGQNTVTYFGGIFLGEEE